MALFQELKRPNVFRVGLAYVVMAWLVMQVADVILNNVVAPGWLFHVLLMFLAIGFLFALFFAWAFELTPEGLKREADVDRTQPITQHTGRKLDFTIIGILVLALGYFAYDKFFPDAQRDTALLDAAALSAEVTPDDEAIEAVTPPVAPDNSIAMLPFVNMSSDAEQEYFSDGLSEELLNLLASIPEMQVTSRSSAFSFKGKDFKIADALLYSG